ncbi:MAG TPA: LacI family DNA-binding transcriptional regulator [Chthoniobacteraceae bacterium]
MSSETAPTMQKIAEACGVSRMAVSLALRNSPKISAATGDRIRSVAESMGYRPNPLVSALMTQLRSTKEVRTPSILAYVTTYDTPDGWRLPGPFVSFYEGAKRRAEQLGYTLEEWWLRKPGMTEQRFSDILYTRDIHGLLVAPLPTGGGSLALDWPRFACATIGYSVSAPTMNRASNDQYETILLALKELTKLGYKRIGMAMPLESDERVKQHWSAGMLVYQQQIPPQDRVPPLLATGSFSKAFPEWFNQHRPEAVLSLAWEVLGMLHEMKLRVPEDVGFAHLALTAGDRDSAGVNQNSEIVGASALELVDAQLRRNERGVPLVSKTLLVPGCWVDGPTVRDLKA